ncbi:adenosylcobinamide-GDP ribazoletransferase [Nocardioides sp. JQ2195]|uniref:adenosylcobinamide-GDP ribazoletransferase n=1 Tax=Nocardioides sp. JQ2195 TaxID=2592334 RepID=UPI00143EAF38|nr:adenosylcobinamide-GDP ribazoletransferase [Nocardioides sp. JQ2195]QIX27041.1 adenosylcobinamide-GDP ribazoletransferase [Nocardioides sp. JQ2195]
MLGTLTAVRVPAPTRVDRTVAGRAMALAPLGGVLLAVLTGVPLVLVSRLDANVSAWALALIVLGALAWLTRGMHLDGLADTADGLGSGRRGTGALEVMKKSDIGPFGVVTLVLVLLLQAALLAQALAFGVGPLVLLLALVTSRGVLPVLCTRLFPAARRDGLGATVSGSVGGGLLVVSIGLVAGLLALAVVLAANWSAGLDGSTATLAFEDAVQLLVAAPCGLVPGVLLALRARNRFGGVTGDVHGAAVEVSFTATLLITLLPL